MRWGDKPGAPFMRSHRMSGTIAPGAPFMRSHRMSGTIAPGAPFMRSHRMSGTIAPGAPFMRSHRMSGTIAQRAIRLRLCCCFVLVFFWLSSFAAGGGSAVAVACPLSSSPDTRCPFMRSHRMSGTIAQRAIRLRLCCCFVLVFFWLSSFAAGGGSAVAVACPLSSSPDTGYPIHAVSSHEWDHRATRDPSSSLSFGRHPSPQAEDRTPAHSIPYPPQPQKTSANSNVKPQTRRNPPRKTHNRRKINHLHTKK